MQGEIFGPLCCSVTIDTFGKECVEEKKNLYYYKNKVEIPPMAMIDDLLCVTKCGLKAVQMNAFINAKSNIKNCNLEPLNVIKCMSEDPTHTVLNYL